MEQLVVESTAETLEAKGALSVQTRLVSLGRTPSSANPFIDLLVWAQQSNIWRGGGASRFSGFFAASVGKNLITALLQTLSQLSPALSVKPGWKLNKLQTTNKATGTGKGVTFATSGEEALEWQTSLNAFKAWVCRPRRSELLIRQLEKRKCWDKASCVKTLVFF